MIKNLVKYQILAVTAAMLAQPVYPQTGTAGAPKEVKAGEVVSLGEMLSVKVVPAPGSAFASIKTKDDPVIIAIEVDAGKKSVTLAYNLSAESKSSDLYLSVGTNRYGPRATIEDFPSWGSDNDKEIETLGAKDDATGTSITFEGKGSVLLLFDVPKGASASRKVSLTLRVVRPKEATRSFVVSL
jgi:hypothetical protein